MNGCEFITNPKQGNIWNVNLKTKIKFIFLNISIYEDAKHLRYIWITFQSYLYLKNIRYNMIKFFQNLKNKKNYVKNKF